MKVDPDQIYGEDYFYPKFTLYTDEFGVERRYYGPSKEWGGFSFIANWVKENIPSAKTLLDVGCSAGSFVDYASRIGFDARGVDISKFAINNCCEGARGKVKLADITKEPPPGRFDLVTAMDLMEHLYTQSVPAVLNYFRSALNPGGYVFCCICTARHPNELWEHTSKNDEVPADKTWLSVSGHVNIKYPEKWIEEFKSAGFVIDYEKMLNFALWHQKHPDMSQCLSWSVNNVLIGRI